MGKEEKGNEEKKKIAEEKKKSFHSVKVELGETEWKKLRKLVIDYDVSVGWLVGRMIDECMMDSGNFPWEKVCAKK